jgi:5-methylcytosine-specific restriction endonuclease McrA
LSKHSGANRTLLSALGIDPDSYDVFISWCLAEELVSELTSVVADDPDHQELALWQRPDGLKRFREILRSFTRRDWSPSDVMTLFERVHLASEHHERKPIKSADLLRLLWTQPHECKQCHRGPPEVVLHVDHIFPASKGGSSDFKNLQFLCAHHNLAKSNRLEVAELWLDSV